MITLTAHLTNGKKYSFEIPEGYPFVEYDSYGKVWIWMKKPTELLPSGNGYSIGTNPSPCIIGRIEECFNHAPQLQRIQFHD